MFKSKPNPTSAQLQQAAQLDEEVEERRKAKRRSFERCDTDGFLSQWAIGVMADKAREQANILRNGGCAEFPVLIDTASGNVIATKIYRFPNKFGGVDERWKVDGYDRKWIPVGKNSRIQKKMGMHEETRWFPARAETKSNGKGLSGNVWIQSVMVKEEAAA